MNEKELIQELKSHNILSKYFPKIYFVLSGGAAKGLAHLGVLKELHNLNIYPEGIVGTSAGALFGSLYSYYKNIDKTIKHVERVLNSEYYKEFEDKYLATENKKGIGLWIKKGFSITKTLFQYSIVSESDMDDLYTKMLEDIKFSDLKLPFAACTTNLQTGRSELFLNGDFKKAIMASTAIPLIFPTIKINKNYYTDGSITSNIPINEAKDFFGKGFYITVDLGSPIKSDDYIEKESPLILALRIFSIFIRNKSISDERIADFTFSPIKEKIEWNEFNKFTQLVDFGEIYVQKYTYILIKSLINHIENNIKNEKNIIKKHKALSSLKKIYKQYIENN